jgi:hypothetical protein
MAFIPVHGVAEVQMIFSDGSNQMENTYYAFSDAGWNEASLLALAADFAAWDLAGAREMRSNTVGLIKVICRDLTTETAPTVEIPVTPTQYGALESAVMPGNVTLAIKRSGSLSGRSYRGRIYWIGLTETQCTANRISDSSRNAILGYLDDLTDTLAGSDILLGVVSRYTAGAPRTTGVFTSTPHWSADVDLDSQRRRLNGRGQ